MPLGSGELERMSDEVDINRTLQHSVYCGTCGYNLRFATYVGVCTECGHAYNARPPIMKGIFDPNKVRFPMREILLALVCLVFGGSIIYNGIKPVSDWLLILGAAIVVLGMFYARTGYRELGRFILSLRLRRRIQDEEDE